MTVGDTAWRRFTKVMTRTMTLGSRRYIMWGNDSQAAAVGKKCFSLKSKVKFLAISYKLQIVLQHNYTVCLNVWRHHCSDFLHTNFSKCGVNFQPADETPEITLSTAVTIDCQHCAQNIQNLLISVHLNASISNKFVQQWSCY